MSVSDVINDKAQHFLTQSCAVDFLKSLPQKSVDLVFGSPPYPMKGERYDDAKARRFDIEEWVSFMFESTVAAVNACRGDVFWVVNNTVSKHAYHPAIEGLLWKCYQSGLILDRPVIWHKNSPPSRKDYFTNDWEFVIAFKGYEGPRKVFNWEEIASPPKYKTGGHFRQRDNKGVRKQGSDYPQNKLARPRDVIRVCVGGGQMGSKLACLNEAPFPENLVDKFVPVFSPEKGIVVDPFMGGGTTGKVALKHGRRFIGCDIRENQIDLTKRRIAELKENK